MARTSRFSGRSSGDILVRAGPQFEAVVETAEVQASGLLRRYAPLCDKYSERMYLRAMMMQSSLSNG